MSLRSNLCKAHLCSGLGALAIGLGLCLDISAFDLALEGQLSESSDIRLSGASVKHSSEHGPVELELSLSSREVTIDYRPQSESFNEFGRFVDEMTYSMSAKIDQQWYESIRTSFQASVEEGYPDHRSIWIDEYYRQVFDGLGYVEPSPKSWSMGFGLQWEWVPANRFLNLDMNYTQSVIAPGYERDIASFPFTTVRDDDELERVGFTLGAETTLSRRALLKGELLMASVTERDPRFGFRTVNHYALHDHLVFKGEGSYVVEGSEFEAYAFQATLEFDHEDRWFFGITARMYEDTGEIEDSLAFSSAAPALTAYRLGLTFSHHGERSVAKVYIGPYWSDYETATDSEVVPFQNLYRDRDWVQMELLYRIQF